MSEGGRSRRLESHEIEIGISEALSRHIARHVVAAKPVAQRTLNFESKRPRWLRECAAEALGVFIFVFAGLGSIAALDLNTESKLGAPVFGSYFSIAWAFALGIMFSVIICGPTSGGHFAPAITICLAIWLGFPWRKVPYFIASQLFGGFLAALLVLGMFWEEVQHVTDNALANNIPLVSARGPAAILIPIPGDNQNNLGFLLLIEFFVCSFIALAVWASIDPANPFVSPHSAPVVIGLAYGLMIMGFAPFTIATNMARDVGPRIVASMFWGMEAFTYKGYSWIAMLVNVPASIFATAIYELLLRDSLAKIGSGLAEHQDGEVGLHRHLTRTGMLEKGDAESDWRA